MLLIPNPIELFYSYAHQDENLRKKLEEQLSILKRQNLIIEWHDRKISPGEEWEDQIDTHLNTSHIILLLISPAYVASGYCYVSEMKRAMERHQAGDARVIPIILRPVDWEGTPFSKLNVLPKDGRAVTRWSNRDEAFLNVVRGIKKVIEELNAKHSSETQTEKSDPEEKVQLDLEITLEVSQKTIEQWLDECDAHYRAKRYRKALASYKQAIEIDPSCALAHKGIGDLQLYQFERYAKALDAYEHAIKLAPDNAYTYYGKGLALRRLGEYKGALAACEEAVKRVPTSAIFFTTQGHILHELERYKEMLVAYDKAIELDPNFAAAQNGKGNAFYYLKDYENALRAYERAIKIDPHFSLAYSNKGYALKKLGRSKEAEQAFKQAQQVGE